MKILTILGTRPQFIKSAGLSQEFKKRNIQEIIIHTGQHYDTLMSDIFFKELNLPKPTYTLKAGGLSHSKMTSKMISEIEDITLKEKPTSILVYGDCNTTLAGALVASKLHINLIHVESGLRSFDKKMPEEVNRILTDHVSNILFCPTDIAVTNLKNEGIINNVYQVGDLMIELLRNIRKNVEKIDKINYRYYLATIHRQENTTCERLKEILKWFSSLRLRVVMPLHPRTKKIIEENKIKIPNNLHIIRPVGYIKLLKMVMDTEAVITDSGGLQKEAYELQKPCFTIRDSTEWLELVNSGWNMLVKDFNFNIEEKIENMRYKERPSFYKENVSETIVNIIESFSKN